MTKKIKKNFTYHLKHKSKLTILFIVKILLVFLVSLLVFKIFYNYFLLTFGLLVSWIISFVIAATLYLILIIKVLEFFKF
ncbi:MAG: hypothetical protein QXX55_01920 [Candidatus Pacearchaeota archaeon]